MDELKAEVYGGRWRITGYTGTYNRFRDGYLELHPKSKAWRCVLRLKCFPGRVVKEYQLTNKIKQIIVGRHVIVELVNGDNIHMVLDPPLKSSDLGKKLKDIKENKMPIPLSPAVVDRTPNKGIEERLSPKTKTPQQNGVGTNHGKIHADVDEGKPTPHRDCSEASQTFLARGQNKSREMLENVSPKSPGNFYQKVCTFKSSRRTSLPPDVKSRNRLSQPLSMSPTYSWVQKTPVKHQSHVHLQGFSNLGNTCYMNAILQSLFGLDMFTTNLIQWSEKVNKHLADEKKNHYLFHVLLNLFLAKKSNGSTEQKCQLLAELKKNISSSLKWFSGFEQHDAHEFLGQILDQLKEEAEKLNSEMEDDDVKSEVNSPPEQKYTDNNPAVSNFEFKIIHTITCSQCGTSVNNLETFNDLSVDIPPSRALESTWSIQDALDLTFLPEQVDYTCEKCGGKEATVQHKFSKLPRVLVIHLKRYTFNTQTSRNMKLVQNLIIPKFLTLKSQSTAETEKPLAAPEPAEALMNPRKVSDIQLTNKVHHTPKRRLNLDADNKEPHRDTSLRKAHESMNASCEDLTEETEGLIPESMTEEEMMKLALERSINDMDTPHKQATHQQSGSSPSCDGNTTRLASPMANHVDGTSDTEDGINLRSVPPVEDLPCDKLGCKNRSVLEPPHKKAKLDEAQCDSAYNSFSEGHAVGDESGTGSKQELNSSGVDMNVSDEENKENYMPPTASSPMCEEGVEPLNKENGPKEEVQISAEEEYDEETQLRIAIENSLKDMENMDIQPDLEDDLEKAKQLSLKEVEKQNEPYVITQQRPKDKRDLKRTKEEEQALKLHAQTGDLPNSYQLVSIVSHIGHSSVSGHYISDTYDMNRRMWYSWNDSHGHRIDWDELRRDRERTGYLFFYAAKDVVEDMENHYYQRRCRVRSLSLSALPRQRSAGKPSSAVKLSFNNPWMELR
ncbi:hypothetical protein LSH36_1047g00005 [Paralvinella palmiformis]|uniref:Ubiquitin carboxyl-terminal hydrolase n=1 Tax=Paralvinella palmiformis TaxID=53620 RepID=A0AAD9MSV2_9ANNE|nr:hypothetical protein LSH36_1047g00005 [Paralvinella palmiformis]